MNNAISAADISKSFDNRQVIQNVSFKVGVGEIFGLLGPSGAGKTTLIKILTGQLSADNGKVLINGDRKSVV